jgi:uncharacterized protein
MLWVAAVAIVAVGVVGTIVPGVPGIPLVLGGLVMAAWIDDFAYVGRSTLLVLALIALVATVAEFAASALGAKRAGAHRRAVVGAVIGAVLGLFMGVPGLVFGPFAGAVIGEYSARGDLEQAGRVGVATWLGIVLGGAVKLGLVLSMVAVFAFERFS